MIDFLHTLYFTGTVIEAHQRTHSLDNSIGRKIEEGLQFVIDSNDYHITLVICGKESV